MFIIAARWILEGERDYGDQTLATPTLQRVHVFRGVVYVVLVSVKLQWVKSEFLVKSRTVVYPITRIAFAHTRQISYSVLRCFVRARIGFHNIQSLALRKQLLVNNEVLCNAQMCLWWMYKAHVSLYRILHESQIRDADSGRSDICILCSQNRSTFIRIYDRHCYCHCRICSPAARIQIS